MQAQSEAAPFQLPFRRRGLPTQSDAQIVQPRTRPDVVGLDGELEIPEPKDRHLRTRTEIGAISQPADWCSSAAAGRAERAEELARRSGGGFDRLGHELTANHAGVLKVVVQVGRFFFRCGTAHSRRISLSPSM